MIAIVLEGLLLHIEGTYNMYIIHYYFLSMAHKTFMNEVNIYCDFMYQMLQPYTNPDIVDSWP